jgi:hypothetical protein
MKERFLLKLDLKKIVFTGARYGASDNFIDVLELVNEELQNSGSGTRGFYVNNCNMRKDPCPGSRKVLKVSYTLDGVSFEQSINECDNLIVIKRHDKKEEGLKN